jgi:hypothetical protein
MQMGLKEVGVEFTTGTQLEAQVLSFGVNATHGLRRSAATKRKVVEMALQHVLTKTMNNSELSNICAVSQSFVAAVRSPEAKQKQDDAKKRHIVKKAEELSEETSQTSQIAQFSYCYHSNCLKAWLCLSKHVSYPKQAHIHCHSISHSLPQPTLCSY